MFNDSKYAKWYFSIISRAKTRSKPSPAEKHHIIPKCMGGIDVVSLTPKEHFICHLLLPKMTEGQIKSKMLWALHRMMFSDKQINRYKPSAKIYEMFRKEFYGRTKGKKRIMSEEHKKNIAAANRKRLAGKTLPLEWRLKMSESRKGERNGMYGKTHSKESMENMIKNRRINKS